MAKTVKCLPTVRETRIQSLGREDLPEKEISQPTPVFLPGKSHGQRNLVGYSPWGRKESDTTERKDTILCIVFYSKMHKSSATCRRCTHMTTYTRHVDLHDWTF